MTRVVRAEPGSEHDEAMAVAMDITREAESQIGWRAEHLRKQARTIVEGVVRKLGWAEFNADPRGYRAMVRVGAGRPLMARWVPPGEHGEVRVLHGFWMAERPVHPQTIWIPEQQYWNLTHYEAHDYQGALMAREGIWRARLLARVRAGYSRWLPRIPSAEEWLYARQPIEPGRRQQPDSAQHPWGLTGWYQEVVGNDPVVCQWGCGQWGDVRPSPGHERLACRPVIEMAP